MEEKQATQVDATTGADPEPAEAMAKAGETTEVSGKQTFTKDEVEKLIEKRLMQLHKKYADYEMLRAKAKKAEEYEAQEAKRKEAELSEVERWRVKAQEQEARLTALEHEIQARTLRYRVHLKARDLGFYNPDEAYKLMDASEVTFDENGEPDEGAIEKALKRLAQDSPYLVKPANPAPNIGADEGRGQLKPAQITEEKRREWRQRFRYQ